MFINNIFYNIKPIMPRKLQLFLRRQIAKHKRKIYKNIWPIDLSTGMKPKSWRGWPGNNPFALVLSHDVDTQRGHDSIPYLIDIEKRMGFKSAFNIVPERYNVSKSMINYIKQQGFEVNVHGLKHDGKLFKSYKIFKDRALKINYYLEYWNTRGFTAPSMICNMDWLNELGIDYSTCTFDTDPFEPQQSLSKTIFPFVVKHHIGEAFHVELPYTLPQDHALFIILGEKNISIWKQKLKWIAEIGGMALLNTHPDYMQFKQSGNSIETYPVSFYTDFLQHIATEYESKYWNALPSEVAAFCQAKLTRWSTRFTAIKENTPNKHNNISIKQAI